MAILTLLIVVSCAQPADGQVAPSDVAAVHHDHGHDQWRHGQGTPGHTWVAYQREARRLNRYLRAVASARMASCSRDPHCAVRLASYLTHAPWPLVARVVDCESGWNPAADNPTSTAGGLFQFLEGTWSNLAPAWGMAGRSRYETWPAAVVGAGTIAQGGISHWNASRHCWG